MGATPASSCLFATLVVAAVPCTPEGEEEAAGRMGRGPNPSRSKSHSRISTGRDAASKSHSRIPTGGDVTSDCAITPLMFLECGYGLVVMRMARRVTISIADHVDIVADLEDRLPLSLDVHTFKLCLTSWGHKARQAVL